MAEVHSALSSSKPTLTVDTARITPPLMDISRPATPSPMARPPTPGGGPLSSHPATPGVTNERFFPFSSTTENEEGAADLVKADSVFTATSPDLRKTTTPPSNSHEYRPAVPFKASPVITPTKNNSATNSRPPSAHLKSIPLTEAVANGSVRISRPLSSHLNSVPVTEGPTNAPTANRQPVPAQLKSQTFTTPVRPAIARKPLTPASANASSVPQRRNSTGVRKLLSLNSLRSSFSSSRNSLALQSSPDAKNTPIRQSPGIKRPSSPSVSTTLSPTPSDGTWHSYTTSVTGGNNGNNPTASEQGSPPRLRKRKSGSWFRRASLMMLGNEELEGVPEDKENYTTTSGRAPGPQGSARDPRTPGVPILPEIKALDSHKSGGWADGMFAGIGR